MAYSSPFSSTIVKSIRGRWWCLGAVAVLCAILAPAAIYVDDLNNQSYSERQRNTALQQLTLTKARLEGNFNTNLQAVQGLVAAISMNPDISHEDFATFCRYFISGHTQIRHIGGAPDMVVQYLYPEQSNELAFGLDYRVDPQQRKAALRARESGQPVVAGPVNLVQGGQGFIGRIPVYTLAGDDKEFWGLISAVIDLERLYEASGLADRHPHLNIAIRGQDGLGAKGQTFYGDPDIFVLKPVIIDVQLPNGSWQMAAVPLRGWAETAPNALVLRLVMALLALLILIPTLATIRFAQKTRANAQLFRTLFDLSPVGMVLSDFRSGRLLRVNQAFAASTGRTEQELLNRRLQDLDTEPTRDPHRLHGEHERTERRFNHVGGASYPVSINSMLTHDDKGRALLWSIVEDISPQKKAECALRTYHADLARQVALLRTIASVQAQFIDNSDFTKAFHLLLDELLALTSSEFGMAGEIFYQQGMPRVRAYACAPGPWDKTQLDYYFGRRDDLPEASPVDVMTNAAIKSLTPVLSNSPATDAWAKGTKVCPNLTAFLAIPILRKGQAIAFIGIGNCPEGYQHSLVEWMAPLTQTIAQIVEGVRTLQSREDVETELVEAKSLVESVASTKSEFLASMSRKVRTPLNTNLEMLSLISQAPLSEKQTYQLEVARLNAEAALKLVSDVVDFARVDSGKLSLDYLDFDIRATIDDLVTSYLPRASEKSLTFVVDLSGVHQSMVKGDPHRFRQILSNLLDNAMKFTHEGGIHLSASAFEYQNQLYFSAAVSDTGPGISPDKFPILFMPFSQWQAHISRGFGSAGLGLAMCKKLCMLMDGDLTVDTTVRKGSSFSFTVKLVPSRIQSRLKDLCDLTAVDALIIGERKLECTALGHQLRALGARTFYHPSAAQAVASPFISKADRVTGKAHQALLVFDSGATLDTLERTLETLPSWADAPRILLESSLQPQATKDLRAKVSAVCTVPVRTGGLLNALRCVRQPSEQKNGPISGESTTPSSTWNLRLLLVEAQALHQRVALMMLQTLGIEVEVASEGLAAIEKLKQAAPGAYQGILMSCQLPGLNGFETARLIRNAKAGEAAMNLPIIALVANVLIDDQSQCLAAGMNDWLAKPLDQCQLQQLLCTHFAKTQIREP